jgi:hypothetical protein
MEKAIDRWASSGLSKRAFCLKHAIPYHRFLYCYRQLSDQKKSNESFMPVEVVGEPVQAISSDRIWVSNQAGWEISFPFHPESVSLIGQLLS